jgi:hypothetical protein
LLHAAPGLTAALLHAALTDTRLHCSITLQHLLVLHAARPRAAALLRA